MKNDVRNQLVSVEMARQAYKVVIDPEIFEIDQEGTAALREASSAVDRTEQTLVRGLS